MFRRLFIGLILGLIVGGLVAAGLVAGLHQAFFPLDNTGAAFMAYLSAAVTGVLTGLVAGKPIWATNAKIEAGLKAFFGALLGAGLMFAMRQWIHFAPGMEALAPGQTPEVIRDATIGTLPMVSLPLLAAVLGGFFELDNTGGGGEKDEAKAEPKSAKKRVAEGAAQKTNGKGKARVEDDEEGDGEEAAAAPKRAKR
jgi:hypothetical protein